MPAWLLAMTLGLVPVAAAPVADVPIDVQVPAFLKALGFERNLQIVGERLVIGIVFDPRARDSVETVDRILATHEGLTRLLVKGKRVDFVPIAFEPGAVLELSGARVVFAASLPEEAVQRLAVQSRQARVLVFSTTPEPVERGLAVGMEVTNGKPGFVVNLAAASSVGASFEASFLALCRIVER